MNEPVRQHFLPQFYLKGFASKPVSEPSKFWLYDFRKDKWDVRTPFNTAVRRHFYTLKDQNEQKNYYLENYFSNLEGKVKELMDRKIEKGLRLKGSDHIATLAVFVCLMRSRVPYFRDKIEEFNVEIIEKMMSMMRHRAKTDPNYLPWLEKDMERKTGEKLGLDKLDADDFLNTENFTIKMNQEYLIELCLSHIKEVAKILCSMNWTILRTFDDAPFVTCDNPYFEINPQSTNIWDRGGLLNKNIEISLPLSSNFCFFASWKSVAAWYGTAPSDQVAQLNFRSMLGAREFVIAPQQDFPGNERLKEIVARRTKPS